jgi:hypothetical protein
MHGPPGLRIVLDGYFFAFPRFLGVRRRGLDLPVPDFFVLFNQPVPLCPTKSLNQNCAQFPGYFADLDLTYLAWQAVSYRHHKDHASQPALLRGANNGTQDKRPKHDRKCLFVDQVRAGAPATPFVSIKCPSVTDSRHDSTSRFFSCRILSLSRAP